MDIKKGDLYYVTGSNLNISCTPGQMFKVQVHLEPTPDQVVVLVKHYKTKRCNKVTVQIKPVVLESGVKYGS